MINNGNHYHPADGVFVAPISGVYMFSWNTLTFNRNYLFTELRVESEVKGAVASYATINQYITGSASLLCQKRRTRLGTDRRWDTQLYKKMEQFSVIHGIFASERLIVSSVR